MLGANILWGLMSPVSKAVLMAGPVSALSLTTFRMVGAAVVFWLASLFTKKEHVNHQDLAKLFFFLTVALSAVFAMEQETGVAVLQTAAGANGRVLRRKLLLTAVLVLLMVTAAFLPRLLAVRGAYGLPEWGAQANSLPLLSGVPAGWRIRTVLGLRALVHVLLGAGGAAVILLLSRKTRSTIQTMLIAAGILVVPTVAAALLW